MAANAARAPDRRPAVRFSRWAEGKFPRLTDLLRDGDLVVETPPRPPGASRNWNAWQMRTVVMFDGDVTIRVGEGGRKPEIREAHAEATAAALAGLRREIAVLQLPGEVLLWVRIVAVFATVPLASSSGDLAALSAGPSAEEVTFGWATLPSPWDRLADVWNGWGPALLAYLIPWLLAVIGRLLRPYVLRFAMRQVRRRL
jgi:hypothetical protein